MRQRDDEKGEGEDNAQRQQHNVDATGARHVALIIGVRRGGRLTDALALGRG